MSRPLITLLLIVTCATVSMGCDSFDKRQAAQEIRDRLCEEWPYGCTDSTRVVVEEVNKTRNGREVEFKVVDGDDETPRLVAAYFEPREENWRLLLFEDPFKSRFRELAGQVDADTRRLRDALSKVNAAQKWFESIYGRYATSLGELDSVSYRSSDVPIEMSTQDGGWRAEASTRYVRCEVAVPGGPLPRCVGLTAQGAGSDSGPLSTAFRTDG